MKDTIKIPHHGNTKMVAHRGLSGIERENTCSAFVAAANRSYFGIETDVRITADGHYVLLHDNDTARNCIDRLEPEKSTFQSLRRLQYKDADETFDRADLMMPTLQEYVKICRTYGKVCVLEFKGAFSEDMCAEVVEIISGMDYLDQIIFISFSWDNLLHLKKVCPQATAQWLTWDQKPEDIVDQLAENDIGLDAYFKTLTKENVKLLHDRGIVVNCWTVDRLEDAELLIDMGVDQITSNILE
ncbi:MAG: hypothetical protein ILO68_01990 [Clostridia bacterium]|nr:hypothetical protein [Clostridia bacterium]